MTKQRSLSATAERAAHNGKDAGSTPAGATAILARIEKTVQEIDSMRDGIFMAEGRLWNQVGEFLMSRNEPMAELAESMGFTVSYIYDVINGRRKVSMAVIEAIRRLK
jgi:hypothetical protein